MKIELGKPSDVVAVARTLFEVYEGLKEAGILQELGGDLVEALNSVSDIITEGDVKAFRAYIDAGMSSDQAVELILSRKRRLKSDIIDFTQDLKRKMA